jgi:hypothetical protein
MNERSSTIPNAQAGIDECASRHTNSAFAFA